MRTAGECTLSAITEDVQTWTWRDQTSHVRMHTHKEVLHGHVSSFMQICTQQQVLHVLTFALFPSWHSQGCKSEINWDLPCPDQASDGAVIAAPGGNGDRSGRITPHYLLITCVRRVDPGVCVRGRRSLDYSRAVSGDCRDSAGWFARMRSKREQSLPHPFSWILSVLHHRLPSYHCLNISLSLSFSWTIHLCFSVKEHSLDHGLCLYISAHTTWVKSCNAWGYIRSPCINPT